MFVDDDALPLSVADADAVAAARDRLRAKRLPAVPFVQDPPPNRFAAVHRLAARIRRADESELSDRQLVGIVPTKGVSADSILATTSGSTPSFPIPKRK